MRDWRSEDERNTDQREEPGIYIEAWMVGLAMLIVAVSGIFALLG